MSKPKFVIISDIHFNLNNLELSSIALRKALIKAEMLQVPLVIAGDLQDTKALLRAEVMNRLIQILKPAEVPVRIIVGNHCMCNEKGTEHALNYLRPYATVIDSYQEIDGVVYIPYQNDANNFKKIIKDYCRSGDLIVMHQGVTGALPGEYTFDKTAIPVELLKDFRCYSGHYHRHQTIGTLTYCGSPFSMSFGEANDGDKGFLVVYEDGSFMREVLNLRRHRIVEIDLDQMYTVNKFNLTDTDHLAWVKVYGSKQQLSFLQKKDLDIIVGLKNYKLDKIVTESEQLTPTNKKLSDIEILDSIVDNLSESVEYRTYLKELAQELLA